MQALLATLSEQAAVWSGLEIVAVLAAILYLVLAIRQHIACWLFALLSTAIYVALFIEAKLYMEAVLNGVYFLMAMYGYWVWRNGGEAALPVTTRGVRFHAAAVATIVALAAINGALLERFSDAVFPYIDSLTTWAALWTTWLVARKVLENWWYWLLIDLVSIVIYWSRGLELTALLFVLYVLMIPFGYLAWRRSMSARAAA
ncbi:MAG: nicotinamide riboside transporter PnuC [Pseudomonadota bacterium]